MRFLKTSTSVTRSAGRIPESDITTILYSVYNISVETTLLPIEDAQFKPCEEDSED